VIGSADEVAAALRIRQSFILTSHARPDGDAIGSQLALAYALDALGKDVRILDHDAVPAPYRDFPGVERISVVPAATGPADAVVFLECSDPTRPEVAGLDGYTRINIDHHLGNTQYGQVNWYDPDAAACGEMVADLIDALGVPWTPAMAEHLYLAIATDTGGFRHGPVTARTFEACRRIAETGVNPSDLSRRIFSSFGLGRVKLTGAMLGAMRLFHRDRLAVLFFDDALLAACGASVDDTEGLVNIPLMAREVEVVALFKQQTPTLCRVSLRSKGDVDVRQVAMGWEGGGHKNAAGLSVTGDFAAAQAAVVAAIGRAFPA
jgi:phosphoesterase RecJ-like protein